jgi:hypothetical protein
MLFNYICLALLLVSGICYIEEKDSEKRDRYPVFCVIVIIACLLNLAVMAVVY